MEDELMTDELPSPPAGEAKSIEDVEIGGDLYGAIPKMGEAIPVGTYAFRLESFQEKWKDKDDKGNPIPAEQMQPYFSLTWKCQQEPHVGRVVFENVPFVKAETVKAAGDPSNPMRSEAQKTINNRMPRAKEIMEAAGWTQGPGRGFKAMLGTNPEMKLQLKIKESQAKNEKGEWKGTGEWRNEVQKHVSLHRPA